VLAGKGSLRRFAPFARSAPFRPSGLATGGSTQEHFTIGPRKEKAKAGSSDEEPA
jgi:hypothetical protein